MLNVDPAQSSAVKRTPLDALHRELSARMCEFAGYEMPIHYPLGVLKEHLHTRSAAALFDVSHMGQIELRPRGAALGDLALALERLVPIDVLGLAPGRQRYGFFTTQSGGIIDDLMIANRGDHLLLIANASRKAADARHLRDNLSQLCDVEPLEDRALLALQGPAAETALSGMAPSVSGLRFMDVRDIFIAGSACIVSRSGYTGEDGFEISVPAAQAEALARLLLQQPGVIAAGLGARDSLRTEAGLCLYGADIDESTTPAQAGLTWAIPRVRRRGGGRAGNFAGADVVLDEIEHGPPRLRVGLRPQERTPVRAGAMLFADASAAEPIGRVTSGGYGPFLGAPVAMGYVARAYAQPQSQLFAEVRGNRVPAVVSELPFVAHRYKRP